MKKIVFILLVVSGLFANMNICGYGVVTKVLKDDNVGLKHEKFIIQSRGKSILVAHNISLSERIPLHKGDKITYCGEYIKNDKGGILHWTHKSNNRKHKSGYIMFNRKKYD